MLHSSGSNEKIINRTMSNVNKKNKLINDFIYVYMYQKMKFINEIFLNAVQSETVAGLKSVRRLIGLLKHRFI